MRKTSISQRWEAEFVNKTRKYAKKADVSITQLTIDAIELLGTLLDYDIIRHTNNAQRIEIIKEALAGNSTSFDYKTSSSNLSIENQIKNFLKERPNTKYSTTQIADELSLVQSTVRTYVKRLEQTPDYEVYPGRPNKVKFVNNI